jgi:endonuclease YncB( thermonuclease family)
VSEIRASRRPGPPRALRAGFAFLAGLALTGVACGGGEPPPPLAPAPAPAAAPVPAPAGTLVLGEFSLVGERDGGVIDGDTIRVRTSAGTNTSVRVHMLDAEETFKHDDAARRDSAADFAAYARAKRGTSRTPVKYPTEAGERAAAFARAWFAGLGKVRLETDEPGLDHDGYGRLLAHVFATKDGHDLLYAEEAIRAGHSPYFVKYGRSRRFDARLAKAQEEARAAHRGVWGADVAHYPDYDERLSWWEERAKQVDDWLAEGERLAGTPAAATRVRLGIPSETARLESLLGQRVTVFGSLARDDAVTDPDGRPPRHLYLVDAANQPSAVVVFERAVWAGVDHAAVARRFVRATGVVSSWRGRLEMRLASGEDLSTR